MPDEVLSSEHSLVIKPVGCRTMESIRARLCRKHRLQSGSAAIFARESVYLNTGFLNGVGLRSQIQHALPDPAGDVESVYDILIIVLALSVCARINLQFGRVVVDTRSGTAGCAGSEA